jgi:ribosomal protein L7/L12
MGRMAKDVIPPQVAALLEGGNKIGAIKELRGITGLGLKEAKDWVDSYEGGMPEPLPEPVAAAEHSAEATFTLSREAAEALKSGNKIEAIKLVRAATGLGLAEAKAIVEVFEGGAAAKNPASRQGLAPGEVASSGGGTGKWIALIVVAAIAIAAALYF